MKINEVARDLQRSTLALTIVQPGDASSYSGKQKATMLRPATFYTEVRSPLQPTQCRSLRRLIGITTSKLELGIRNLRQSR